MRKSMHRICAPIFIMAVMSLVLTGVGVSYLYDPDIPEIAFVLVFFGGYGVGSLCAWLIFEANAY